VATEKSSAPHPEVAAGDPFLYAAARTDDRDCPSCFGGYVTLMYEEDGQEHNEAVPCKACLSRCSDSGFNPLAPAHD
jgi:hypothetical protein